MKPSAWLARHRPVEQMTWAPGLPNVIKGRVISGGGWIEPTLAADKSTGGAGVKMTFQRVIVYPNGHREIEGVRPKQLPSPSPVSVENNDQLICVEKPSQNSASDDQ